MVGTEPVTGDKTLCRNPTRSEYRGAYEERFAGSYGITGPGVAVTPARRASLCYRRLQYCTGLVGRAHAMDACGASGYGGLRTRPPRLCPPSDHPGHVAGGARRHNVFDVLLRLL